MTLPNIITVARLLLVPVIIWSIIEGHPLAAFIVFVIAGIGDGVDGFIARQYNLRSRLGAYLDPVADKTLLVSIYLSLTSLGEIPVWLAMIVVSRDLFIIGGVILAWILDRPIEVHPLVISKINTAAQIILAAVILGGPRLLGGSCDRQGRARRRRRRVDRRFGDCPSHRLGPPHGQGLKDRCGCRT